VKFSTLHHGQFSFAGFQSATFVDQLILSRSPESSSGRFAQRRLEDQPPQAGVSRIWPLVQVKLFAPNNCRAKRRNNQGKARNPFFGAPGAFAE
jgi:hypothetical protein